MVHDQASQSSELMEDRQRKTVSALSRRDLLKLATVAGSVSGVVSSGIASATESGGRSETIEDTLEVDDDAGSSFSKVLLVEGTGTGLNSYRFSVGDTATSEAVVKARVKGTDEPLVTGEVRKECADMYYFTGEVIDVSVYGSIIYHVRVQ